MEQKNLLGPDLSEFNGAVDFEQLKKSCDFVLLRCGYGSDYPGQEDTQFQRSAAECRRLNIPYGVYLYAYAADPDAARNEAAHTLRLIKGQRPELGVWYDVEAPSLPKNPDRLAEICLAYLEAVEAAGHPAGLYSNLYWFEHYLTSPKLERVSKWVAQWNEKLEYRGDYTFWQFTNRYSIPGLPGLFDMNRLRGSLPFQGERVRVTPEIGLNIRSGPGTSHPVLRAVPRGTILTVVSRKNGWGELKEGGWVSLEYAEPVSPEPAPSPERVRVTPEIGLNIRSGPGISHPVLRAVPRGTVLTVVSRNNGWGELKEGGWVSLEYTEPVK